MNNYSIDENTTYAMDQQARIDERLFEVASEHGSLADRYRNYLALTDHNYPLSFDEWLDNT